MVWGIILGGSALYLLLFAILFLRLKGELMAGLQQTSQGLESKVANLDFRVEHRLADLSQKVQNKLEDNLKQGFQHLDKVQEHLKQTELQLQDLNRVGQSIHDLNSLLKLPHLRGGFGEATLERILSDLLPAGLFELQYRISPGSAERVDAVVRFPQHVLPIDSKFPREQILPLFEAGDPAALEKARKDLSDIMKGLARQIREKYIHPEHGTTEMALLFIPSETIYFEVLRNVKLCEELGRLKVFAVSPNTLAVTLQAVAASRRYYEMAKGVEKTIAEVQRARQHFDHFEVRFDEVGVALGRAQQAHHIASTHLSRYTGAITRLSGMAPEPIEGETSPERPPA